MKYKLFLSHRRAKARTVAYLKRQLCIRGAGGWKDTDDIPTGKQFEAALIRAINDETGGFIFWATKDTLQSRVIREVELPTALNRAENDPTYPVVPVFVEIHPDRDRAAVEKAIGADYARRLLGFNGETRHSGQTLHDLAHQTSRTYARQLVEQVAAGPVEVAMTAFRAPTEQHHLTMDWRSLFDEKTRTLTEEGLGTITEALGDVREALQTRDRTPAVEVDITLPLPLAMLAGYEWRQTTQLRVTIKTVTPGSGELLVVEPAAPERNLWPDPRTATLSGSGPFVVAVSVGATLGTTVDRYAAEHDARGFEHLHIERDGQHTPMDAREVRALAAHIADRLNALQAEGVPKHLLLRGPATLAFAIGLAANGTGPTWVPFYDGHDYYANGLFVG